MKVILSVNVSKLMLRMQARNLRITLDVGFEGALKLFDGLGGDRLAKTTRYNLFYCGKRADQIIGVIL